MRGEQRRPAAHQPDAAQIVESGDGQRLDLERLTCARRERDRSAERRPDELCDEGRVSREGGPQVLMSVAVAVLSRDAEDGFDDGRHVARHDLVRGADGDTAAGDDDAAAGEDGCVFRAADWRADGECGNCGKQRDPTPVGDTGASHCRLLRALIHHRPVGDGGSIHGKDERQHDAGRAGQLHDDADDAAPRGNLDAVESWRSIRGQDRSQRQRSAAIARERANREQRPSGTMAPVLSLSTSLVKVAMLVGFWNVPPAARSGVIEMDPTGSAGATV